MDFALQPRGQNRAARRPRQYQSAKFRRKEPRLLQNSCPVYSKYSKTPKYSWATIKSMIYNQNSRVFVSLIPLFLIKL
jgi:hypothetical protein